MPRNRAFAQVDVFSATPFLGNPVAVVLDAADLADQDMQRIARWTNLSETTFVLEPTSPGADYRLRIFTPDSELPFAGHPTLGSAHAWLEHGGQPKHSGVVIQECEAGLVTIRRQESALSFQAPPTRRSGPLEADHLARMLDALGISPDEVVSHQWVDNGPGWGVIRVATAERVLAIDPNLAAIPDAMIGVIGSYPVGSEFAYEMRAFAPGVGVAEDPVCGSMNAGVGQWLTGTGEFDAPYRVSQGARLGRAGDVSISSIGDNVWVGGDSVTCVSGFLYA